MPSWVFKNYLCSVIISKDINEHVIFAVTLLDIIYLPYTVYLYCLLKLRKDWNYVRLFHLFKTGLRLWFVDRKLLFSYSYKGFAPKRFFTLCSKKYFLKWVMGVLYNMLHDIDLEGQSYGPGHKFVSTTAQHYVCVRKGLTKSIHARPFLGVRLCTLSLRP